MSDSNLSSDIIRSLLSELINKVNETKGDRNLQKQNDTIISALKDISDNIKNNKIDEEKLVKDVAKAISDKINPIIRDASDAEIKTIKEENNKPVHSGGNGGNGSGGNGNKINPDATEPNKNLGSTSEKLSNSLSRVNYKAIAAEAAIGGLAMVADETTKGLRDSFKIYSELTNAGADFNGNLGLMRKAAADSGMTLEQFSKSITTSNSMFRTLGYEQISRFNRSVVDASNNMAGLALTVEQRQEYENDYINVLSSQGKIQSATTEDVTNGFLVLVKQSKGLSSVFGDAADSIAKKATEFLNSSEGYSTVTMLARNQGNATGIAEIGQSLSKSFQIDDKTMQSLMNYGATGVASPELLRQMGSSAATYRQYDDIRKMFSQMYNSNTVLSNEDTAKLLQTALTNIANTSSQYDRVGNTGRGVMNANPNAQWDSERMASYRANRARNMGPDSILNRERQSENSIDNPSTQTQAGATQYRIDSTDLKMLGESIQSAVINGLKNTISTSEKIFDDSLHSTTDTLNKTADKYVANTNAVDKNTAALLNLVGNNGPFHAAIGSLSVVGELLLPLVGALIGNRLIGVGIASVLRSINRNGGGLSRGLNHFNNGLGRRSSSGTERAASTATSKTIRPANDNSLEGVLTNMERTGSRSGQALRAGRNALGRRMLGSSVLGSIAFGAYDELNDYSDYKKGNITGDQLKENTYKNVGGTAGAGLGGWGGAAAGAAIGSMILPGIGTVIGGGLGGILGAWGGQNVGENIGEDGYHIMNPTANSSKVKSIQAKQKEDTPILTEIDYLKNININVEAIKSIMNPSDISNTNSSDNDLSNTTTVDNPFGDDNSTNEFSDQPATNKTEADLDSILSAINDIVDRMDNIVSDNQKMVTETSTQNQMLYSLLNKLNTNVAKQANKRPGIIN